MNENKLRKLFEAARRENPPSPDTGFAAEVMRAIHREPAPGTPSVLSQLGDLFPRLAVAALVLIAVCFVGDFCASALELPDLENGVAQLSEQWLFATKGF